MGIHEATVGFEWLYSTLSADSSLSGYAPGGIWRSFAPIGTGTPYVILGFMAGPDVVTMNGFRLFNNILYQVKAVGPGSNMASINNAASRIDALIGSPPTAGTAIGGAILSSYRQSILYLDELVNGELWTNLGGLYWLITEQF